MCRPGRDECLLGRILGRGLVVEYQASDDQEATDRGARQLTERVVIATHRPLHEIPLHRASGGVRDRSGRATDYERRRRLDYLRNRTGS